MLKECMKKLALIFTMDVSLKTWYGKGMISREVKLYNSLSKHFDKIYFFTYGYRDDLEYSSFLEHKIDIIPMPLFFSIRKLRKIMVIIYSFLLPLLHIKKLKDIEFIKTNQMKGAWAALFAKKIFKCKFILRTGYTWSKFYENESKNYLKVKLIKLIESICYKNADEVIVSSNFDRDYIKTNYKINCEINVIPNYVDVERFRKLKVQKIKNSIIFIGRLENQKNLFNLLKAIVGLNYKLTIIGEGSLLKALMEYATTYSINVKFIQRVPNEELPVLLNKHEIFILPSLYEGTPKVLLEAMACGMSVIGTNVVGINEIIIDKFNGLLCETDPVSIHNTIINLVKNGDLKKKLGNNARDTIIQNFTFESYLGEELELYKN